MKFTRRYLSIAGFEIYWYAVLIVAGIAAAYVSGVHREKRMGLKKDTVLDLMLCVLPAGFVGARLYYVLLNPAGFDSLVDVLNLRTGGLAIYGGVITGLLAGFIYARVKKLDFVRLCDLCLPCVALAQSVGRWGNFLNQEAYGAELRVRALQFFPLAVNIDGAYYAAAFFYESVWCLGIYLVTNVPKSAKSFAARGRAALGYLTMYAFERCAVEGIRTDSLYLGTIRASQLLSALVLTACGACVLRLARADRLSAAVFFVSCVFVTLSCCGALPAVCVYCALPPAAFALVRAQLRKALT
ncbi:MAG: prolipoprotein diacylglyceryl transferase [Clostridia bacterium]|nr:prolipoprotein diacylglyceryl transferase [Clostridia bacterium]